MMIRIYDIHSLKYLCKIRAKARAIPRVRS